MVALKTSLGETACTIVYFMVSPFCLIPYLEWMFKASLHFKLWPSCLPHFLSDITVTYTLLVTILIVTLTSLFLYGTLERALNP